MSGVYRLFVAWQTTSQCGKFVLGKSNRSTNKKSRSEERCFIYDVSRARQRFLILKRVRKAKPRPCPLF